MAIICVEYPLATEAVVGLVGIDAQTFGGIKTIEDGVIVGTGAGTGQHYGFRDDADTYISSALADTIQIVVGGKSVLFHGTNEHMQSELVIEAPDGDATTPSFHCATGASGMYGPTNALAFTVAESEKFRVTSDGNFGIGATSFGTSAVRNVFIASGTAPSTSPADGAAIWVADRGGTAGKAGLHIRSEDGTSHVISDNVGIGTTTPLCKLAIGSGSINDSNLPFQMNAPASGEAWAGFNKAGGYGFMFGMVNSSGFLGTGISGGCIRMVSTDSFFFAVSNTTIAGQIYASGCMNWGAATGGDKGHGTINAKAVYDDNTLLTDWIPDLAYDGKVRPEDEQAAAGRPPIMGVRETVEFVHANRHLPSMPSRKEWTENGSSSLGQLTTRLWETVERMHLHIEELHTRLNTLEARNA